MNKKPTITRDGDCIVVHIPMTFKRRGGRKEIIVPQGLEGKPSTKQTAQNAILVAIARAFRWKELVESGRVKNLAEIARVNKVDGSYVSRILDLTLLAPDIIDAILAGKEPSGLSLAILTKKRIPLVWEEQRQVLGFGQSAVSIPFPF